MATVEVGSGTGTGTGTGTGMGAGTGAGTGTGTGTVDDEGGFPWWGWVLISVAVLAGGGIAAYFIYQGAQLEGESDRVYEL
jgi:hypothetical protein